MSTFYALNAETPKGPYPFEQLKGKVVLIVNVASKCGYTPKEYPLLQQTWDKYKDHDFVLLGFPCDQFAGQEFSTDDEIASFCTLNHGVTFPIMKKSDVNGDNANEVFKYLKSEKSGILGLTRIKWNFEKFLVDKEGKVFARYATTTSTDSLHPTIEKLLAA